jgi:hypothetical protein
MPVEVQLDLLKRCERISPRYRLLTNGIIETDACGKKMVKLLCRLEDADSLKKWAMQILSAAATEIKVEKPPARR